MKKRERTRKELINAQGVVRAKGKNAHGPVGGDNGEGEEEEEEEERTRINGWINI